MQFKTILFFIFSVFLLSCSSSVRKKLEEGTSSRPKVAFLEAFEDPTIAKAKEGFLNALASYGYSQNKGTLDYIYKNAEGSPGTMNLAVSYLLSKRPDLIATSTTLSTLAVSQRTKSVPVFMMVSPDPKLDGLSAPGKPAPVNLCGVYEDLDYIDTAITLIPKVLPKSHKIAAIYSQGESQSATAFDRLKLSCKKLHLELDALPVNSSSETRLVVRKLMDGHPDAFFALPDNSVFASFETITAVCRAAKVPIFTSEEGLVDRGALAAFGADIYQWGYQSGVLAGKYLRSGKMKYPAPVRVAIRKRVFNALLTHQMGIIFPAEFKESANLYKNGAVENQNKPLRAVGQVRGQGQSNELNLQRQGKDSKLRRQSNDFNLQRQGNDSNLWIDAILSGLCLSFLAFGIFLSLRIFQIPDITTDGSFTMGAVITGVFLENHLNAWLALPISFLGAALAGSITGFISTRFRVNALLAGILVMTGMYSINLFILGRANLAIEDTNSLFSHFFFQNLGELARFVSIFFLVLLALLFLVFFLQTDYGISMRATGSSPVMARSVGIKTNSMQISGLALANGFTGIAGFLIAQFQGFVDIGMGTGIVLTGLGSVLIGDSLADLLNIGHTWMRLICIIVGSILFQVLVASALSFGVDPLWIKLITSGLVLMVVIIPKLLKKKHD